MSIEIKRTGETIEFDISKIVNALRKACQELFDTLRETIMERLESIYCVLHEFGHWLMHCGLFNRSSKDRKHTGLNHIYYVATLYIPILLKVSTTVIPYNKIRGSFLMRSQDRGQDSDDDSSYYTQPTLLTR